jgi:hypothetical protein
VREKGEKSEEHRSQLRGTTPTPSSTYIHGTAHKRALARALADRNTEPTCNRPSRNRRSPQGSMPLGTLHGRQVPDSACHPRNGCNGRTCVRQASGANPRPQKSPSNDRKRFTACRAPANAMSTGGEDGGAVAACSLSANMTLRPLSIASAAAKQTTAQTPRCTLAVGGSASQMMGPRGAGKIVEFKVIYERVNTNGFDLTPRCSWIARGPRFNPEREQINCPSIKGSFGKSSRSSVGTSARLTHSFYTILRLYSSKSVDCDHFQLDPTPFGYRHLIINSHVCN